MERSPSLATPSAAATRPTVLSRLTATQAASATRPTAFKRSLTTQPAARTRPLALPRSLATPPAAATRPWDLLLALLSLRQPTLFVSAPVVQTWTTPALSATYAE